MKIDGGGSGLPPNRSEEVLKGISASPGIEIGMALVVGLNDESFLNRENLPRTIPEKEVDFELQRFQNALARTKADISSLREQLSGTLNEKDAGIFDAHLLLVDDKMLMKEVCGEIQKTHLCAEYVFSQTVQRYVAAISSVEDPYLKERAADVSDVANRVLSHLYGEKKTPLAERLPGQRIIVARDLTPTETVTLDRENVQAFATETGARTSHSAILARSMKIPAVVGIPGLLSRVRTGDMMIIDGVRGIVILNPAAETLDSYANQEAEREKMYNDLLAETDLRLETLDGYRVELAANIDDAASVGDVKTYGACGIGLFRTEYLFLNTSHIPTEEEQYAIYAALAEKTGGAPVVIRTLDVGGDKVSSLVNFPNEANPFLGMRSVRLCLAYPQLLIPQLRAILRAGVLGNVRMMFPMITCEDELDRLLQMLEQVKSDLRSEKVKFCENMEIGMMMETPAAALCPEQFAGKCDFFSIGTNDLVQYVMAVDRGNERLAGLYRPMHPVILRLIRGIVKAANRTGIKVSVCGEMASDPHCIPLLIGLGVRELSMGPVSLIPARQIIRKMKYTDAESLAEKALKCTSQEEVTSLLQELLPRIVPESVKKMQLFD